MPAPAAEEVLGNIGRANASCVGFVSKGWYQSKST